MVVIVAIFESMAVIQSRVGMCSVFAAVNTFHYLYTCLSDTSHANHILHPTLMSEARYGLLSGGPKPDTAEVP